MKNTIQLVSLLHELGMAIGLDLQLQSMLKQFTKVCIRQLNLTSIHYYILQDAEGKVALANTGQDVRIKHFLSIPEKKNKTQDNELPDFVNNIPNEDCNYFTVYRQENNEYVYFYTLGKIGIIKLHRSHRQLDEIILELLKPILRRLTVSCQASIEHEQLLNAINAREEAEKAISFIAFHDDLTRLPNRRLLKENLSQDIARSKRHGFFGAVLYLDLNRFKMINDTLGHTTGDQLLITVANILKGIARKEDTVARLSGDEFVVQLSKIASKHSECSKSIESILDKIHQAFSVPIIAGNHVLHVTPSIGVKVYPGGDEDVDDILHHADTAMYQAKKKGRNVSVFYEEQLSIELKFRLNIEKELQLAVKELNEFELHYQPQYTVDGTCIGAEALLRWNNSTHGRVSPAVFIPIAEKTGLMLDLGEWVIEQACQHASILKENGLPESFKKISVNVSALQFSRRDFIRNTMEKIEKNNITPELLGIELTESTLIKDIDEIINTISKLRDLGISTSIDDFGTGYSSLAYLNRFPIDTLKIDQAFVRDIQSNHGNLAIVDTIMSLGKNLNLSIIAEGIETEEELNCLDALNCKYFQGYYFSKPVPFSDLLNMTWNTHSINSSIAK